MSKTMISSAVLAVSLMTSTPVWAHEEHSVEAVLESYSQALEASDISAAEHYVMAEGTDFTIFEGSGVNTGWADYRDHHLGPELASETFHITVYDWTSYSIEVDGDLAVARFDIALEFTRDGESGSRTRHGTAILKFTDSGWRISHLHTS